MIFSALINKIIKNQLNILLMKQVEKLNIRHNLLIIQKETRFMIIIYNY